jgi:prepilin-type N-terminal cleavage/methylation domain-containing protein
MKRAFSLIELLIALVILAVLIGIITPRLLLIQRSAKLETASQQARVIQAAVIAWQGSFATLADVDTAFETGTDLPSDRLSNVDDYIDSNFLASAGLSATTVSGTTYYSTGIMRELTGTAPSSITVTIGGQSYTVPPANGVNHAHMRIYWPNVNRRLTQPLVIFFTPN